MTSHPHDHPIRTPVYHRAGAGDVNYSGHIGLARIMFNRAQDEMVEGYMDGRNPDNPEPNQNRSEAYRHGFQSGRDDLSRQPSAPVSKRRKAAERIIAEDA